TFEECRQLISCHIGRSCIYGYVYAVLSHQADVVVLINMYTGSSLKNFESVISRAHWRVFYIHHELAIAVLDEWKLTAYSDSLQCFTGFLQFYNGQFHVGACSGKYSRLDRRISAGSNFDQAVARWVVDQTIEPVIVSNCWFKYGSVVCSQQVNRCTGYGFLVLVDYFSSQDRLFIGISHLCHCDSA